MSNIPRRVCDETGKRDCLDGCTSVCTQRSERELVDRIAGAMRRQLDNNRHRGGWHFDAYEDLALRADAAMVEFQTALALGKPWQEVLKEVADCSNLMSMAVQQYQREKERDQ